MKKHALSTQTCPGVFLDRDGTIIEDRGHLSSEEQVAFIPGAIEALRILQQSCKLFIVTNQSGVSRGVITGEQANEVNAFVVGSLEKNGVRIEEIYTCFHSQQDQCACIKPKPYFLHRARDYHGIDLARSFSVGDHPHDVTFAENSGGKGIYVLTGHGEKHRGELEAGTRICASIVEAAQVMLRSLST